MESDEGVSRILESLGLNKNEIFVYLDLIKHGKSGAHDVSKRTKIHRSSVYDSLKKLIEIGFIEEIVEEHMKLFRPLSPNKIEHYMKEKEKEVKEIIPYLQEIYGGEMPTETGEEVSTLKGIFAVREALMDLLEKKETLKVFGSSLESVEKLGDGFLAIFHKERIKKGVVMKHIFSQEANKRAIMLGKMALTEAKCFPKKYYSIVSTNLCGDSILFIIFGDPVSAIRIKSEKISSSYHNYFEILWDQAKSCYSF